MERLKIQQSPGLKPAYITKEYYKHGSAIEEKKVSERTIDSQEKTGELLQRRPNRDSARDCFSGVIIAILPVTKMYSILRITLQKC